MQRLDVLVKICYNFLYDLSMLLIILHFDLFIFFGFFLGFRVIEFTTRYRELGHWKALIEENKTYTLYNCHVFDNENAFKPVDHLFMVVFRYGTKVQKDDELTNILTHEFRFKSFKEI